MREIDVRAAVQDFSQLVADMQATAEVVTITKDGVPAAVLLSAEEFESMQETIFWLSQPGIREDIEQAEQEVRAGRTFGEDEIRTKFGVPKRSG